MGAMVDVAVVLDFVHLIVLAGGVVHHHVVFGEVGLGEFLVEGHGGVGVGGNYLAFGILLLPGELGRGFAHGEGKHAVDGGEHLGLLGFETVGGNAFLRGHVAQLQSVLAQLECDEAADGGGVVGVVGLGHGFSGHEAVFVDEVGHAGELATVADGVLEEPFHLFAVHGLLVGVDNGLEEEVGFLELVVEEEVGLRELEVGGEVVLANGFVAQHVHAGEHPAAAGGFLVGDGLALDSVGEVGVEGGGVLVVEG